MTHPTQDRNDANACVRTHTHTRAQDFDSKINTYLTFFSAILVFGLQARFSFPPSPTPAPLCSPPLPPPDQLSPPSLVESFKVVTLVHRSIIVLFVAGVDTIFFLP